MFAICDSRIIWICVLEHVGMCEPYVGQLDVCVDLKYVFNGLVVFEIMVGVFNWI